MVLFIVEMEIQPYSFFFSWSPNKENINLGKQKKILILHTKDKKWLSVVKGLSDACIKVDSRTKDDAHMAWHGMAYMKMWHEVEIIFAL